MDINIKRQLLELHGTKYFLDYTETIINKLIEKDESNRAIIEEELSKYIEIKEKEYAEELKRCIEESKNWNLVNVDKSWFR